VSVLYLHSFPTRRSSDLNTYGSWANGQESFGIALDSPVTSDATGNVIHFCRAESPHGNYGSPFALHGRGAHVIANSKVLANYVRSEEHTSELQSRFDLVC